MKTLQAVRTQVAIRSAWEQSTTGSISKLMEDMVKALDKRERGEATFRFNDLAIGEIVKRMNLETIPKDAIMVLAAVDYCDKFWPERHGGIYMNSDVSFEVKAKKLAEQAWEAAKAYSL